MTWVIDHWYWIVPAWLLLGGALALIVKMCDDCFDCIKCLEIEWDRSTWVFLTVVFIVVWPLLLVGLVAAIGIGPIVFCWSLRSMRKRPNPIGYL